MLGFSFKQKESATKNQLLGKGKKKCTRVVSIPAVGVLHVFFVSAPGAGLPGTPE